MTLLNFTDDQKLNGPISQTHIFSQDCILVIYNILYYIAHIIGDMN